MANIRGFFFFLCLAFLGLFGSICVHVDMAGRVAGRRHVAADGTGPDGVEGKSGQRNRREMKEKFEYYRSADNSRVIELWICRTINTSNGVVG